MSSTGGLLILTSVTQRWLISVSKKFERAKWWKLALTALTGSGAVGVAVLDEKLLEIATALVALVTLYLTAYLKDFDLGVLAQRHSEAAAKIWPIRESYQSLLVDLDNLPIEELAEKRDQLLEDLAEIYALVPQTNDKAYLAAQKGFATERRTNIFR